MNSSFTWIEMPPGGWVNGEFPDAGEFLAENTRTRFSSSRVGTQERFGSCPSPMALVGSSLNAKRFALRTRVVGPKAVVGVGRERSMPKTCRLGLLTWTSRGGRLVPQCNEHPSSEISVVRRGREVVVICEEKRGFWHQLKMCSKEVFDAEQGKL